MERIGTIAGRALVSALVFVVLLIASQRRELQTVLLVPTPVNHSKWEQVRLSLDSTAPVPAKTPFDEFDEEMADFYKLYFVYGYDHARGLQHK